VDGAEGPEPPLDGRAVQAKDPSARDEHDAPAAEILEEVGEAAGEPVPDRDGVAASPEVDRDLDHEPAA
jgi:hypothetical protein